MPNTSEEFNEEPPLLIVLLFNSLTVVVLVLVLGRRVSLPCVPPQAIAWSLAIVLLLLCQLFWRYLGPVITASSEAISVGTFAVPIRVLASLFNALHPWRLSNRNFCVGLIVLFLAAGFLGLSLHLLVPLPPEETPVVQNLSVQYLERNGTTISSKPCDVIEIMAGERILVKAETLGQADALCTWSTANGNLQPAGGCSTLYSASYYGTYDILDILAQSPCKTRDACASLHIKVVP